MRHLTLAVAGALVLVAGSTTAQTSPRNLDTFVTEGNRIPKNPTALLRADTRRLMGEYRSGVRTVVNRIGEDRAAGRTPPACPPDGFGGHPMEMLAFLNFGNGIPQPRRAEMTVADGIQTWIASRYPCAA